MTNQTATLTNHIVALENAEAPPRFEAALSNGKSTTIETMWSLRNSSVESIETKSDAGGPGAPFSIVGAPLCFGVTRSRW
jgi:hypothetical protein